MKRNLLIAACLFSIISVHAQTIVKGIVVDAVTADPLSGATIIVPGKSGTSSDKDGRFTIPCGAPNKITVSFVGYEILQYNIQNCDEELRVALVPLSKSLNVVEITATSNPNKSLL